MRWRVSVFVFVVMAFLFTTKSVLACKGSEVLYEDNFTSMDPAWGTPSDRQSVKEGKMALQPEEGKVWSSINQANLFEDMDACVKMRIAESTDPSWGGGLIFWAKGYDDYYYLLVNGDGWFAVRRWVNNRGLDPVPWRENAAIKKGVGEWNQLRVVTKGNQATVYINDTEVVTLKGQPPQGGSFIGMIGNSPSVWEFSELKVTKPSSGDSINPPTPPAPGEPSGSSNSPG